MKNGFTYFFALLCMLGILSMSGAHVANAEDTHQTKPTSIQVSPVRIDWDMKSGESRVGKFNVRNYANEARNVSVSVENFFVSPDSEHVNLFDSDANHPRHMYNVVDWFILPENFTLAPGEGKDVEFTITVPEGQPTNGYYGTILFETTNKNTGTEDSEGAAQLGVNYRIGSIITLAVHGDGDPKMSGVLQKFVSAHAWYGCAPMSLTADVLNDGNMHYKMEGEISVRRFGKKFATIVLEPEVFYPDAMRTFTKDVPFGTWDFGVYNAALHLQSEQGGIVMDSEIGNIYVLPIRGMIYSALITLGIVVFVWFVKNYVSIGIKKKQETS